MPRTGVCNGCGACCRFLMLQVHPMYMEADKKRWVELHGIRLQRNPDGGVYAVIDAVCQHLTQENQCGIFGSDERPKVCDDWPFVQHDIDLLDAWAGEKVCSYTFASAEGN